MVAGGVGGRREYTGGSIYTREEGERGRRGERRERCVEERERKTVTRREEGVGCLDRRWKPRMPAGGDSGEREREREKEEGGFGPGKEKEKGRTGFGRLFR